nr:uncharacterized protein LOC128696019 [Cherax quadricarinatus]
MAPRCCMIVVVMGVIMAVTAVPHGPGQHGPGFGRKPAPAGSDCPLACPASYFPVCGSDGKTYGNECGLQAASCRDPTITKIGSGECETLNEFYSFRRLEGIYSERQNNGRKYEKTITYIHEHSKHHLVSIQWFAESDSSECTFYCSSKIVPVCGSDGKSYSNSCRLRLASCKDPSISQAHDGVCVNGE